MDQMASTTTMRTTTFVPSDTIKWNDTITAPIIIPVIAIIVIITFFLCALIKCLKVTWDKKRRSDMYEITDLLPQKSKSQIPDSIAIDEGDIELPNENEKLHHRHGFMSSTSNNSSSPSPVDNLDDNGIGPSSKRPVGAAALRLLKFSNLRSIVTKKSVVSTTMAAGMATLTSSEEVTTNGEQQQMVTLDIESGLESGTNESVSTSVKHVNSNGRLSGHGSPGHRLDSSNDTNDSNFGDELDEEEIEVPGYMNSNLDEVDTPIGPSVSPPNPLRKAPIALTESEV